MKKKVVKFILSWAVSVLSSTMCFLVILCDWAFFLKNCLISSSGFQAQCVFLKQHSDRGVVVFS